MSRRVGFVLGLVIALASASVGQDPAPAPAPGKPGEKPKPKVLALVGGDVHTVSRGLLRRATVIATDGKLTAIGVGLTVPEGAETIDCAGKHVCPGFVAATSFGIGIAGGRGGKVGDSLDPFDSDMDLPLAGGITAVHVSAGGGGGVIGGETAVIHLAKGDLADMLVREPAAQYLGWPNASATDRQAAREGLEAAREHVKKLAEVEAAKARGEKPQPPQPDGKARPWLPFVQDRRLARVRASSAGDLIATCELAEAFGLRVVFEDATEAWSVADRLARAGALCLVSPRDVTPSDPDLARDSGSHPRAPAILRDAGVKVAVVPGDAGVDTGGIAGQGVQSLAVDAALAVRGGLTDDEALRAITLDAARALGVDDRLGSLDVGKDADCLVLDGAPLDYRSYVTHAIVAGKVRYEKAKHTLYGGTSAGGASTPTPAPGK